MPRVLITVPGKTAQPYRFDLERQKVTIGRSSSNDISIDCPSVSGHHCDMERVDGGYILRDHDSTNGISLSGKQMAIIDLKNDIEVHVGDARFEYTLSSEELDQLDDEDFKPHAKKATPTKEKKSTSSEKTPRPKARPAVVPPPVMVSTDQGGGFFLGLLTFIFGILAFWAGLDHSYVGKQKAAGREGEFSLLQDAREGRPPALTPDQTEAQ